MVTLQLNGRAFPSSLLGNLLYTPDVFLDGRHVRPTEWSLTNVGGEIAHGDDALIEFTPTQGIPHSLYVRVLNIDGYVEEVVYTFNVVLRGAGAVEVGVNWAKGSFAVGEMLRGTVYVADPEGQPPQSLAWTLYRNNVPVSSGTTPPILYPATDGVFRVKVVAYDARNVRYEGDSAIAVTQNYALQSTLAPAVHDASCVYLGAVYSDTVEGAGGIATSLPYQLASYTQEVWLLPGTTHIQFDLDPLQSTVDDEVVVRTLTGNWVIRGYPTGLYNESVGYDYLPVTTLPAPADQKMRFTVDAYNVHGLAYTAFNFRVRVKCYRNVQTIWRYEQCAYAIHPGGEGRRDRKWALLFSQVDAEVDVDSDYNRYRSGRTTVPYTTPIVTSLPGLVLSAFGSNIPVDASTGLMYTEANRIAIYEAEGYPELDAKAVSAAEDVRPFSLTLEMPATPPLIQRIKRLGGTMGIYLSNGAVAEGAVITVRIQTSLTQVVHQFTMPSSVYVNSDTDFLLVGTVDIADITDFQFDHNGIVATFYVDETAVVTSGTLPQALPSWGPTYIHSGTHAALVNFDGACYTNPQKVPVYEGESIVIVDALTGDCANQFCGPVGVYCYTSVCAPFASIYVLQPYNYPAPYVALPNLPYRCYGYPVFVSEGTVYSEDGATAIFDPPSGANVSFPVYVSIYSSVTGGQIYFTLDGSDPRSVASVYTGPVVVEDELTTLKAVVRTADGLFGPVATATYSPLSEQIVFGYLGEIPPPDYAGQWGQFTGNSANDYHWSIQFLLASDRVLERLELYQNGPDGIWVSNQVASTAQYVDVEGSPFAVWPLVVWSGPTQLNAAYTNTWGNIASGSNYWNFYANVAISGVTGWWRLVVYWNDGGKDELIVPIVPNSFSGTVTVPAYGSTPVYGSGSATVGISSVLAYADASECGEPFVYTPCNGAGDVLVVYPCDTVAHAFVEHDGECYALSGSLPSGNQVPGLNFDNFDNWTVEGRVDLIGSCPASVLDDLIPGNGMYVDLVGSPGTGTLTSRDTWSLPTGTYRFSIDIAGNQRTTGTFSVGLAIGSHGTIFEETGSNMPFTRFRHEVYVSSPETGVKLKVWQNAASPWGGIVNAGNLIDDIHFYRVGGADLLLDSFDYFQPPVYATVISVGSTTPAADCEDVLCTGSTPFGDSYVYEDLENGSRVHVYFERLDLGVPFFAVSPTTVSEGTSGLSEGQATLRFDHPRKLVMTVAGTGQLRFKVGLAGIPKKLVQVRAGTETIHALSTTQTSRVLTVQPGDQIYIDVGTPFGGLSKRIADRSAVIAWVPKITLPKLYATGTLEQSGSIRALGFCGLTNQQGYTVFDVLPADTSTAGLVNPDAVVTAHGANSAEYVLIRNRAAGDVYPPLPDGLSWYGGQTLTAPIVFSFYAAREFYGAHGEMDVWVQTAGTFPQYFKVSPYKVLGTGSYSERVAEQVDDTSRNSLRVVETPTGLYLPRVYTADDGERRTIHSTLDSTVLDGKTFNILRPDPGISYRIYEPGEGSYFAVIADFHGRASNPGGMNVVSLVGGWNPEFVLSNGDTLDASPSSLMPAAATSYVGQYWNQYPFYVSIGNHDRESVTGLNVYKAYFGMPSEYYDFVRGDVHWFVMDTGYNNSQYNLYTGKYAIAETEGEMANTPQGIWLKDGLAASTAKWKIVLTHHAGYSSCVSAYFPSGYLQYIAWRLPFAAWGASAVLFGHNHLYERLTAPDGTPHLGIAPAGASLLAAFNPTPTADATSAVRYSGHYGALRGRVTTAGLVLEWWDVAGVLIDSITLPNP